MAVADISGPLSRPSRALPWFRGLTLVTVLSTFALVVLGAVVRVTGSGLGCPDWPLCHGGILPPLNTEAIIEYSHRVTASFLVGPLVLATFGGAWLAFRRVPWLVVPATLAVLLLLAQAILGGVTVVNELPGAIVAAHLALGEALLACLILVSVVANRGALQLTSSRRPDGQPDRFPFLMLTAGVGIYLLMLSGSYVTMTGATGACLDWPLCQGDVFPEHRLQAIHMGHRLVAAIIGVFVIYTLHLGIREKHRASPTRFLAMAIVALLLAQMLIGAVAVWLKFPAEIRALHLGVATAGWGMMAWLVALSFTRQYIPDKEPPHA
jgi:heme A synthase